MSDEDDYDNSQDDAEGDKSDVGDEFVDHEEEQASRGIQIVMPFVIYNLVSVGKLKNLLPLDLSFVLVAHVLAILLQVQLTNEIHHAMWYLHDSPDQDNLTQHVCTSYPVCTSHIQGNAVPHCFTMLAQGGIVSFAMQRTQVHHLQSIALMG